MKNYYEFLIPRLNGLELSTRFRYYRSLVKKGVAGFIIFGGRLPEIREHIHRLQEAANIPLIIASDLEQGLGQHVDGGTVFPPAMAVASAVEHAGSRSSQSYLIQKTFSALAEEASYAGINTIFAPVLDINTNPKNPIIAVRSFGEKVSVVSRFGTAMIRTFTQHGISACGKHFPGHGDTETDSHISLPTIPRDMKSLMRLELVPFMKAISEDVPMMMLGHLNVPALDPSGTPVSLSAKAVSFLRRGLGFRGILITDAMNMGGISRYSEEEASFMALKAGVDIILHPSSPEKVASYLAKHRCRRSASRLRSFRKHVAGRASLPVPDFEKNRELADFLTKKAIQVSGNLRLEKPPFLVVLNDDDDLKGSPFIQSLRKAVPSLKCRVLRHGMGFQLSSVPSSCSLVVAIFSSTKAWKGGASGWLRQALVSLSGRADLLISFGSPYMLDPFKVPSKMHVYWDSETAQIAAVELLKKHLVLKHEKII